MRVLARSARSFDAVPKALVPISALALLLVATACSSDATGPEVEDEEEIVDLAPEIASFKVSEASTVYLRGVLEASVTDPEDNVTGVVVDWGDGETVTISSNFDDISRTHDYDEHGDYTVTVSALDAGGNQVEDESELTLEDPPGLCLDIKVFGVCGQVHPNYRGVDVSISALGNELETLSLSTTKNHVDLILPGGAGDARIVVDANFSKTKGKSSVRFRTYLCTFFGSVCTSELVDKKWTW